MAQDQGVQGERAHERSQLAVPLDGYRAFAAAHQSAFTTCRLDTSAEAVSCCWQIRSGADKIDFDEAFGAQWDTVVGRVDAGSPDPAGRVPAPGASTAELMVSSAPTPSI